MIDVRRKRERERERHVCNMIRSVKAKGTNPDCDFISEL